MMTVNQSNIFVHSSPPKAVSGQGAAIRQWVKTGDLDKLETVVLEGQGARLLGLMESTGDAKVKAFLRSIPGYMAKVDLIHDAVIRGSLRETQALLDKRKLATARDAVGRGLAHKAVLYNHRAMLEWLARKYPETIQSKDNEGRNCLHYTAAAKDAEDMYDFVVGLGGNPETVDIHGRKPIYYISHPDELDIEGPYIRAQSGQQRSFSRNQTKRARRISPISPKASGDGNVFAPSPFLNVPSGERAVTDLSYTSKNYFARRRRKFPNSNSSTTEETRGCNVRARVVIMPPPPPPMTHRKKFNFGSNSKLNAHSSTSPTITRAQIRIWIHERDVSKLERIVWSGHGEKLLLETTNNSRVRRFLDNVPHLLSRIKSVHTATINNDVDTLKDLRARTEIEEVFTSKDSHGLTPLHKAAGLGNRASLEYLLYEFPSLVNESDNEGKTPLHYAARADPSIYTFLTRAGADENVVDSKGKTPSYYRTHTQEFDTRYVRNIPDAPRVTGDLLGWDRGSGSPSNSSNKRKISNGEFNIEDSILQNGNDDDTDNKFRRTDSLSGKSGKSSTGKYELNPDIEINAEDLAGEEEEEMMDHNEKFHDDEDEMMVNHNDVEEHPEEPEVDIDIENDDEELPEAEPQPEEPEEPQPNGDAFEEDDDFPPNDAAPIEDEPEVEPNVEETRAVSKTSNKSRKMEEEDDAEEMFDNENDEAQETEVNGDEMDEEQPEPMQEEPEPEDKGLADENEAEDGQTAETGKNNEIDEVVEGFIQQGDMEKLVDMVLEGRGSDLLGKQSSNSEVQEFLVNVPAYMAKISSIHMAASTGNLRDLQTLLDRKRLALAQDEAGRGPLHKAVLHNHSGIARYLIANFPQSLHLLDHNHRSALHYAATLPDSGVMYKQLIQAGADPNVKDYNGNTPGIYLRRKDLLSHSDLMEQGVRKKSMSRRSVAAPSSVQVDSWQRPPTPEEAVAPPEESQPPPPPEEGKHVAIKVPSSRHTNTSTTLKTGQSHRSSNAHSHTHAASVVRHRRRPSQHIPIPAHRRRKSTIHEPSELDPLQLSALETFYNTTLRRESGASLWTRTWRRLMSPAQLSTGMAKIYVKRFLTRDVFDLIKHRATPRYGANLMDCVKFFPQFFLVAPDPHVYATFEEVFLPFLAEFHEVPEDPNVLVKHKPMVFTGQAELLENSDYPVADVPSKFITQVRLKVSRNVRPYPFISYSKRVEELQEVNNVLKKVFAKIIPDYDAFELEALLKEEKEELIERRAVAVPELTKMSRFWPKGRSFFISQDNKAQLWINGQDHLDLIIIGRYGRHLHTMLEHMLEIYSALDKELEFHYNGKIGWLTSDPRKCGTAFKVTYRVRLPHLMHERGDLISKCDELKLSLKWKPGLSRVAEISSEDWIELENVQTFGLNENEIVVNTAKSVIALIQIEEDMSRATAAAMTKPKKN